MFSPGRADLRLLGIDDDDAHRCMHWPGLYVTVTPLNYTLLWLVESQLPERFILDSSMRACRRCRPQLCKRMYRAVCDRTKGRP